MAEVSAKDVAALRKATGAGMMDCKRALEETDADFDRAKDWLREKSIAGAAKRAGRDADQGAIEVLVEGPVGALVELNCETDFVAKGDVFRRVLTDLTKLVVEQGDTDIGTKTIDGQTVDDLVTGLSGSLGEKIELGRVYRFETDDGVLDGYKHIQNERGTVGVLVELGGVDAGDARARGVAHDIALHIASAAPRFVSRDDVPSDEVERERAVLEAQTREEGKPEQAWPKIIEGKLNGFFKTVALVEQPFVKDNKQTVGALVKTLGPNATVRRFARVKIGEE
ncbi:MAG TPA: translation elongation factor Ts [Acidimicrobiia bacterium]|nr:translation elongation factor Ts [Acidimicrobiia bacterium]